MNRLIITFVFIMLCILCDGQTKTETIEVSLEESKPSYLSISELKLGMPFYAVDPSEDEDAGYVYRMIVLREEIYSSIYFEKLILDIEGGVSKIEWSKKLELTTLLDYLKLSNETIEVLDINWLDDDLVSFRINDKHIELTISNSNKLKLKVLGEVDKLLVKLESAYRTFDIIQLRTFIEEWSKDVQPNKLASINRSEKSKVIYDIYEAFYTPQSPFLLDNLYDYSEFAIIQNHILYSIVPDSMLGQYYWDNKHKQDTISNFRPMLNSCNKKVLYLSNEYQAALEIFLNNEEIDCLLSSSLLDDGVIKDKSRGGFLALLLSIIPGHWSGWHLETHPEANFIEINNELNRAVVHYRFGYQGGKIIFEKKDGIWLGKESDDFWIE